MQMTKTAIKRGVTFMMVYIIAVGFGLFSLGRLRIDLWPKLDFPVIAVITQYTGVGPYDIETVVTRPLEETVASVQNVKKVTSQSRQGLSLVLLEFEWGTDMDQAEIDVRKNLDFVQDYLPDEVTDPLVFAFDPSMQPIMFMSVGSDFHGLAELRRISEHELEPRIERVPGVASANTMGGLQREIQVFVDPVRLRGHHIAIEQVSMALQANNIQLPSGWVDDDKMEFSIQTQGEYGSVEEIANTSVALIDGTNIRIKDVADVQDSFVEQRQRVLVNDKPSVLLIVQKQSDANTVDVTRKMTGQFDKIQNELPKGVEIEVIWSQAEFITRSMSNLGVTALLAIVLAFGVLLFFLRQVNSSLIVAVSIPVSMVLTFAVMDQAGMTLNMISMAGLALAVGLLVDNSIVVLENIFRHQEMGKNSRESADLGTSEVAMAITASTLTTVSVFVPVLFVPGIAGAMFKDMVVTICFSLGVSLIVALTLVPLLASRILKRDRKPKAAPRLSGISNSIGNGIERVRDFYVRRLDWAVKHRKTVIWSTIGALVISIFIMVAFLGGEFMPEGDMGYVQMTVDRSPGTSLEAMEKSVKKVNEIIKEFVPEAEMVYNNIGQGEGVFAAFSSRASNESEIMVRLAPRSQRSRNLQQIQDDLRERFKELPDLDISFEDRGAAMMMGGGASIVVQIFGHDLSVAEDLGKEISKKVEELPDVTEVEMSIEKPAPELKVKLDRQRIADLGLSTAQIGGVISTSIMGSVVSRFREGGDEYDIRVRLKPESRENEANLGNILIMTPAGRHIPLRAVAEIGYGTAPAEILREDQERLVTVSITCPSQKLQDTTRDVNEILDGVAVPNDFRLDISGQAEEMAKSFKYLGLAFLVAMLLVYMVMASQFESLRDPFIILFTIPMSIIGVALGLFLTGTTLSVMSLIGVIMLLGIIVNNGIVLVDYINQLRSRGHAMFEAIHLAGEARMRPVIMTASTTILAMLPLALGIGESGENWAPMARSVIGGLMVGTVLTLIVVPVIYASVELRGEKRKAQKEAKRLAKST